MWRGKLLIIAILAAAIAMPASAHARSRRGLPGIFGVITSPLRAMMGKARPHHHARRARPRRNAVAVQSPEGGIPSAKPKAPETAWVGPLYWPYAAADVIDFVFSSPSNNHQPWTHGYTDILAGIFRPAFGYGEGGAQRTDRELPTGNDAIRDVTGAVDFTDVCGSRKDSTLSSSKPSAQTSIERIERMVQPMEEQRAAFDALRDALKAADESTMVACPAANTQPAPPARLKAMADRLLAMHRAALIIRTPLEKFYNSLNDEQKARLNSAGSPIACAESAAAAPVWPTGQIEDAVQPTKEQRQALEILQMTSARFAQFLAALCPKQLPTTPLARLDATDQWLNAMLYAAMTINRPLAGFYLSLSDDQKIRFQMLGSQQGDTAIR